MEKLLRNTLFSETKRPLRQFLKQLCLKLPKESSVYMVGGLVRDILLNATEGKDIDLMVDLCSAEDIITILVSLKKLNYLQSFQKVGKSFPVFKIKIYQFDEDIDLALARTEVSTGPGHTDFEIDAERISASFQRSCSARFLMIDARCKRTRDDFSDLACSMIALLASLDAFPLSTISFIAQIRICSSFSLTSERNSFSFKFPVACSVHSPWSLPSIVVPSFFFFKLINVFLSIPPVVERS